MTQLIHFQAEKFSLDYLTFNIHNSRARLFEFAEIFYRHGFNSRYYDVSKEQFKPILQNENHQYSINFRLENDSWNRESLFIQFSAHNARRIHYLIKNGFFSISQLNCDSKDLRIGRIDLQFIRKNQNDDSELEDFFQKSLEIFQTKKRMGMIERDRNDNPETLALGNRHTQAYFIRIYKLDADDALKFELEIRKYPANSLGYLLLNDSFQQFEDSVSRKFVNQLQKSICLETSFTDWLNSLLRLHFNKPKKHLFTSSLQKYFLALSGDEKLEFYRLLQFLSFIRSYSFINSIEERVNDQTYLTVEFPLIDFMRVVGKNGSTYQRNRFLKFFQKLQGLPPYREKFADSNFRQLLFFPVVNAIQEKKYGPWIIRISIAEMLMEGNTYLFHFPPSFLNYSTRVNLEVKLSMIQALAEESSSKKIYYIQSFRNRFSKERNSIQAQVKREIIHEFNTLIQYKIIEPKFLFQLKDNQQLIYKEDIQLRDIQSSEFIYFYEILHSI